MAIAVPAAVAGALVGLLVAKVVGWLRQRRQRKLRGSSRHADEEGEEEWTGSDSQQDEAVAYNTNAGY